jgi:uncharacterized protein
VKKQQNPKIDFLSEHRAAMQPRINVITPGVRDFLKSLEFYREGLGWKAEGKDDIAIFPLNGIVFVLYPGAKLAEDVTVSVKGSGFSGITIAYLGRNEREVDAVLEQAGETRG